MDRNQFIYIMDDKLKLIRTEYGLNQMKMAEIIGISKKTLVEIEKKRKSLGWTGAVAVATIFSDSEMLNNAFGGNSSEIIIAIAFNEHEVDYPKTWGGKLWWRTVSEENGYKIQQNMVSGHYRILDVSDCRIYASFNLDKVEKVMEEMLSTRAMQEG